MESNQPTRMHEKYVSHVICSIYVYVSYLHMNVNVRFSCEIGALIPVAINTKKNSDCSSHVFAHRLLATRTITQPNMSYSIYNQVTHEGQRREGDGKHSTPVFCTRPLSQEETRAEQICGHHLATTVRAAVFLLEITHLASGTTSSHKHLRHAHIAGNHMRRIEHANLCATKSRECGRDFESNASRAQ